MFNVCVERAIPHDVSDIIPSFNQRRIFTVYRPRYSYTSKQFINTYGCDSFGYHSHGLTGLRENLQTGYIWRIIYKLKPTGL